MTGTDDIQQVRRVWLANMRQELMAPVSAIMGYAEILHEEAASSGLQEITPDLDRILASAQDLSGLVDRLLDEELAKNLFEGNDAGEAGKALRHDLRTPINAIKGYGEMLLEDVDQMGGEGLKSDFLKLLSEANHLLTQLDAIIDFTRADFDFSGDDASPIADLMQGDPALEEKGTSTSEIGTILVVDDNESMRDILTRRLTRAGHRVVTVEDGEQALRKVKVEDFDVILLDVMMPGMNGFSVCRALKDDEETRLIPVVIMTGLDAVDDRVKGIEAGADEFLTKPVDNRELLARIQTVLKSKHTVDRKIRELRQVKDHFAHFVPEAVKKLVADNPEAPELSKQERDVSVLFLDISGYTRLSEQIAPEELNKLVEHYFSSFLDHIHDGGGDINETAGDGFMAIFQDPDPRLHAQAAVDTALAMLATTEALSTGSHGHPALT
ncbi:MAG: response regulator, partial [Proteobacteria bacterium]|nr:response regulator [Pseudomonadota bacterium]